MEQVIDLNYVKKEQEKFSNHLERVKGINTQLNTMEVLELKILHLQTELFEALNESKLHKEYDNEVDRDRLIEELSDCLSMIGNISNITDTELIIEAEITQVNDSRKLFRSLIFDISRLDKIAKMDEAKKKLKELIIPQFLSFVYSLGFNLEELREAYFKKMQKNYLNPKFM